MDMREIHPYCINYSVSNQCVFFHRWLVQEDIEAFGMQRYSVSRTTVEPDNLVLNKEASSFVHFFMM